jgi:hypothetical protein
MDALGCQVATTPTNETRNTFLVSSLTMRKMFGSQVSATGTAS